MTNYTLDMVIISAVGRDSESCNVMTTGYENRENSEIEQLLLFQLRTHCRKSNLYETEYSLNKSCNIRKNTSHIDRSCAPIGKNRSCRFGSSFQLKFDFFYDVVHFVSVHRTVFLNQHTVSFFVYFKERALEKAAIRMGHDGIYQIGQMIQMSPDDILPYLCNNRNYLCRMENRLSEVGLALNSRVPWWKPRGQFLPQRRF